MRKLTCFGIAVAMLYGRASTGSKIIVPKDRVYLGADGWMFSWSPGMPGHPSPSRKAWAFEFPSSDGVHYLTIPYTTSKPHKTLTITFKLVTLSGQPKFVTVSTGCNRGATFTPMLERADDNMAMEFGRWWGMPYYKLTVATGEPITLTFPLTPDRWGSVYGKTGTQALSQFADAMKNIGRVGLTFGGGCYAGHGNYVTGGKVRFQLIDFQIQ